MRDPEVVDFRMNMLRLCEEAISHREMSDETRLQFMHPPDLDSTPQLAPNLLDKLVKRSRRDDPRWSESASRMSTDSNAKGLKFHNFLLGRPIAIKLCSLVSVSSLHYQIV